MTGSQALSCVRHALGPNGMTLLSSRHTHSKAIVDDEVFEASARRVIDGALAVVPGEHVVIVADEVNERFAQVLADATQPFHATVEVFKLEVFGPRPHATLRPEIRASLERAHASVLHITFQQNEYPMRAELVDVAAKAGLRHAHMVGVTSTSIAAGLAADPFRIAQLTRALRLRILPSSRIVATSEAGMDVTIQCESWCRWYETSGVIQPGTKANLPGGELVTSPGPVNGVYVADGSVANASGTILADLAERPIRIELENGFVRKIDGDDARLVEQLSTSILRTPNLDRVGLINFGTNLGMTEPADDIFTNQKLPGLHLSLGLTFPQRTGASWNAMDWIAFTTRKCDIDVDDVPIMRDGRYRVPPVV